MERKTAHEIDAEAAGWAARLDRGPLSPEEDESFRAWCEGDPRRLGAFGRMRAIALASEKARALGPNFDPAAHAPQDGMKRRTLLKGVAAAAAGLAAAAAGVAFFRPGVRHEAAKGETRIVALGDGSVVTLNTQSALAVAFSDQARSVQLLRGEALFDVAPNPQRPFIVEAGDTEVRVVGTSFLVRRIEDAPVEVLVREGVVEVSKPRMTGTSVVRLAANMRAVALPDSAGIATRAIAPSELRRETAWQDGLLVFEGQALSAAVAEFARYSDVRIVIADPALAREEIAGLFKATDPVGFARTVATSLKAHAEIRENEVRLSR